MRRANPAALIVVWLLASSAWACADPDDTDDHVEEHGEASETGGEGGESSETGGTLGDRCEDTAVVLEAPTRFEASLRGATLDDRGTLVVPSPGAAAIVVIAPDDPHSDAHAHPCTGWRRPERVERLVLPAGLSETASLHVHADDPQVGLALRGSSCLPEHARACAPASEGSDPNALGFGGLGQLASLAAGEPPLLFIELPNIDHDLDEAPGAITVTVELFD